jgi:hypothetical protein
VLFGDEPGPDTAVLGCTAARHGVDGTAWYPRRPSIDSGAVSGGAAAPVQQMLDVWAAVADVAGCAYPC